MKFFWLDLETTGLKATAHDILEIAIAEANLMRPFELGPVTSCVRHFAEDWPLDPFIFDMHTKNGLLKACYTSTRSITDIEDEMLELVPEVQDKEEMPVLAGSSVHFDYRFLQFHMSRLAARFSHRHYDVSALKLECQSLGMTKIPKGEAHRAAEDIRESVAHARLCRGWLQALYSKED